MRFCDERMERAHSDWGGVEPHAARRVFADLEARLDQPIDVIANTYWTHQTGADQPARQRVAEAQNDETVTAYYATTLQYLYELSYWEASREKQAWFRVLARACRRYHLRRVVDFGGGVGGLTLFLRSQGIACDYLDVPGKTSEYARWRFTRHAVDVAGLDATAPATWPHGAYDAVTAWDVLEHVFDLDDVLQNIATLLRPGGWFLSKSTFAEAGESHDIHLAKHACYADVRRFNELLTRHRFSFVGQLKPDALSRLLRSCGVRFAVAGILLMPRLKHGGNFLAHRLGPSASLQSARSTHQG